MNIPTGKPLIKQISLKKLNYNNMLFDLFSKKFNGYICLTIKDKYGYEDSFIVMEDGLIQGAYHKFLNQNKETFGDKAIKLFVNSLNSNLGSLDVYSLTKEQTELILTFNEKIKHNPIKDIKTLNQYNDPKYKDEIIENYEKNTNDNKYDLFKKIGLGNIQI